MQFNAFDTVKMSPEVSDTLKYNQGASGMLERQQQGKQIGNEQFGVDVYKGISDIANAKLYKDANKKADDTYKKAVKAADTEYKKALKSGMDALEASKIRDKAYETATQTRNDAIDKAYEVYTKNREANNRRKPADAQHPEQSFVEKPAEQKSEEQKPAEVQNATEQKSDEQKPEEQKSKNISPALGGAYLTSLFASKFMNNKDPMGMSTGLQNQAEQHEKQSAKEEGIGSTFWGQFHKNYKVEADKNASAQAASENKQTVNNYGATNAAQAALLRTTKTPDYNTTYNQKMEAANQATEHDRAAENAKQVAIQERTSANGYDQLDREKQDYNNQATNLAMGRPGFDEVNNGQQQKQQPVPEKKPEAVVKQPEPEPEQEPTPQEGDWQQALSYMIYGADTESKQYEANVNNPNFKAADGKNVSPEAYKTGKDLAEKYPDGQPLTGQEVATWAKDNPGKVQIKQDANGNVYSWTFLGKGNDEACLKARRPKWYKAWYNRGGRRVDENGNPINVNAKSATDTSSLYGISTEQTNGGTQ